MSQIVTAPKVPARQTVPPAVNSFVAWLLRSPFHRLVSGSLVLVTYRGRKSGIEKTFPVGYATSAEEVVILVGAAEAKTWWRNFVSPWPITLVLRGRTVQGTGLAVDGESDEGARLARCYFDRYPARAPAHSAAALTFVRVNLS